MLVARTRTGADPAAQVDCAVLAALLGDGHDSELRLMRARGDAGRELPFLIELASAFVLVETGHAHRAGFHLALAEEDLASSGDPVSVPLFLLLQARSVLAERGAAAAIPIAAEAGRFLPAGEEHAALRAYASILKAELELEPTDFEAAERDLAVVAKSSGILAARADVLRARVRFARTGDAGWSAPHLDRAIDRLARIGAVRDLALACLERAVQAGPDPHGTPGAWLARAESQLATAGGPADLEALRNARAALDRRNSLRPEHSLDDSRSKGRTGTEEQALPATGAGRRPEHMVARLAAATQELASIEDIEQLLAAVPRLALAACDGGTGAQLVRESGEELVDTLAASGGEISLRGPALAAFVRDVLSTEPRRGSARGTMVVVPVGPADGRLVLVVEGSQPTPERDLEQVAVLASFVEVSLARARSRVALREAAEREAAMLGAVGEGVLVTDPVGTVRALNNSAATALGVRRDEAVGRRLRELPGLSPLGFALARQSNGPTTVSLPSGDVVVRPHGYDGGVVSILRDLASEHTAAKREVGSTPRFTFERLVGKDPAFAEVLAIARRAAAADLPILITGESGTGKELLAQAMHNASGRAAAPFVGVNVTAIPRDLVESELFGYEGGTFTGARQTGMAGKFELAARGTILLDEIGDMPHELQGKLLRVLQERVVQRLGSVRDVQVRARVIATTHRDLEEAVAQGRFRLDLFHRLRVVHLKIPPLRKRKQDILLLAQHQLKLHAERTRRRPIRLAPSVAAAFEAYDWPGNIRELCNVIESEASLLPVEEDVISRVPHTLLDAARATVHGGAFPDRVLSLEELERRACSDALVYFEGNVTRAAQALGVSKTTLYAKMRRYDIPIPEAMRAAAKLG